MNLPALTARCASMTPAKVHLALPLADHGPALRDLLAARNAAARRPRALQSVLLDAAYIAEHIARSRLCGPGVGNQYRKVQATEMLKLATLVIELNDEIEAQADSFVNAGVKPLDALHLASASWAKADYFCTCDDKLLNKRNNLTSLATEIVSPLRLVAEVAP